VSIRIVRRGNTGQSNDHNLLINRGERDQHAIESITGLKAALAAKYEKPESGIPRSALGFPAVSSEELEGVRSEVYSELDEFGLSQIAVENRITAVEQIIALINDDDPNGEISNELNVVQINGFYETTAIENQDTFNLSFDYVPGANQLEVYIDGVLAPRNTYTEMDSTSFKLAKALYGGEVVTAKSDIVSKISSPIHQTMIYDGNPIVTLEHKYNVGDNSLSVFNNGRRLDVDVDYTELSSNQIKILDLNVLSGSRLTFRRETHMAGKVVFTPLDTAFMTWSEKKKPEADKRTISLTKTFLVGGNMIQVFCDGILMEPGISGDYNEVSQTSIKFNYDLDIDDEIRVVCNAGQMQWKEKFIAMNAEKTFVVSNPYNPGLDELEVYENGILLSVNEDYTEVNRTTVLLSSEPEHGSVVIIFRRR